MTTVTEASGPSLNSTMIRNRVRAPSSLLLLLGIGLSLVGCGSDAASLSGTWTGRCSASTGRDADLTARFADKGQYSSSSSGPDGETAGTYQVTGPDTLTITNQAGSHVYHYHLNNSVLTLLTTTRDIDLTCNLKRSGSGSG